MKEKRGRIKSYNMYINATKKMAKIGKKSANIGQKKIENSQNTIVSALFETQAAVSLSINRFIFVGWSWTRLLGLKSVSIGLHSAFSRKNYFNVGSKLSVQMN